MFYACVFYSTKMSVIKEKKFLITEEIYYLNILYMYILFSESARIIKRKIGYCIILLLINDLIPKKIQS